MKFIVNRTGSPVWNEVPADSLIDWAADGDDKKKTNQKQVKAWTESAKHGMTMTLGVNTILAVNPEIPPSIALTSTPGA